MKIAIYPNLQKELCLSTSIGIIEFLEGQGVSVVAPASSAQKIGASCYNPLEDTPPDFFLSLGGDGTILQLANEFFEHEIPIVGINLGSLGFLADIPTSDIYLRLQDLLDGKYKIEERMVMHGTLSSHEDFIAVNDIVVHRGQNPSIIEVVIHVDGVYLNTFAADGVILSTPSGSTAYSLAAGGPIVSPNLDAIILTPISPHTISNRPLVMKPEKEIQVQYINEYLHVDVTADGAYRSSLSPGQTITVRYSEKKFRLVKLSRQDYFTTLRKKLGWIGRLKG